MKAKEKPAAKMDISQSKGWEEDIACSKASEEAEAGTKEKTANEKLVDVGFR